MVVATLHLVTIIGGGIGYTYKWECACGKTSLVTFRTESEAEEWGRKHVCR